MKVFSPLILLCVAALSIATAAGSYNLQVNSYNFQYNGLRLHKRQEGPDQDILCGTVIATESCRNGYYQELASFAQQCNDTGTAEILQGSCSLNSNGVSCATLIDNHNVLVAEYREVCRNNETCSSECRDLLISARNELGCCINAFNNTDPQLTPHFAYSQWSDCGVELVTQQCTSVFDLPPVQAMSPICEEPASTGHVFSIICQEAFVNSIRLRLSETEGCEDFGYLPNTCNTNSDGVYCVVLLGSSNQYFAVASRSCTDTSTCDPGCIETLNNVTDTIGCCFNKRFNTTDNNTDFLSYEFWSRCGLRSPGFCKDPFNGAARLTNTPTTTSSNPAMIIKASSAVITFILSLATIMVMLL